MKITFLFILTIVFTQAFAQVKTLDHHKFIGERNMDRGVSLNFINDSTCVRWHGSVSWGGSIDTLKYTINKDTVSLHGMREITGYKTFRIQVIDPKEYEKGGSYYLPRYYTETDVDNSQKVILLIGQK